jgi:hypothetical protein
MDPENRTGRDARYLDVRDALRDDPGPAVVFVASLAPTGVTQCFGSGKARIPYCKATPMLAKMTSKNQLTLPKSVVEAVAAAEYFDVEVRAGQIVLTPVRIQRGDAMRAKLAALGLADTDVSDAMRWARSEAVAPAAAEPAAVHARTRGAA